MKNLILTLAAIIATAAATAQANSAGSAQEPTIGQGEHKIEEVIVTDKRSRLVTLGYRSRGTGRVLAGWFDESKLKELAKNRMADEPRTNHEMGVPINFKHDSDILSFGMYIRQNGYGRALFRLSFYDLKGDMPGERIVRKDIRFEVNDKTKGHFKVDLTQYGIRFAADQRVAVTLTMLEDEMASDKREAFMLDAALLGRGFYGRKVGEAWDHAGFFTATMYLNARVYP